VNLLFQNKLKQLLFKTFYHNQVTTFGYDDLFADQRVIVLSITNQRTTDSEKYINGFVDNYKKFKELSVDKICVVDSTDWLIGPYIDKCSQDLIGLPDRNMQFVGALAEEFNYHKELIDLARYWQYITIINNGKLEKFWHNPFKSNTMLHVLKSQDFRYKKLSADVVLKYLVDNTK